jgi:hypothetical protein
MKEATVKDRTRRTAPAPQGTGLLRRKCDCGAHTPGGATCVSCERGRENLRRAPDGHAALAEAPDIVGEVLRSPGSPLDAQARAFMEPRFKQDFSRVRVHTGARADESARAVGALAYTVGPHVVFGAGRYAPETAAGRRLLAHELAHTIQQRDGFKRAPASLEVGAPESAQEVEADALADAVMSGRDAAPVGERPVQLARQDAGAGGEVSSDADIHDAGLVAGVTTPTSPSTPSAPSLPYAFEADTELGGLSVASFDFLFRNCEVLVNVRVKFQFEDDITPIQQAAFKIRFFGAVHGVWGNSGYHLTGSGPCPCHDIPIRIVAQETMGSNYHKLVDVELASRRENVISDMNLSLYTTDNRMAHEFGHVLGLYDEYDGGWIENHMFWHRNRPDDPNALMNEGSELRERYFSHYRRRVQETAGAGCDYTISSPVPPVSAPAEAPTPPAPTRTIPKAPPQSPSPARQPKSPKPDGAPAAPPTKLKTVSKRILT